MASRTITAIFHENKNISVHEKKTIIRLTAMSRDTLLINDLIFTASLIRDMISPMRMVSKKRWGSFSRCL